MSEKYTQAFLREITTIAKSGRSKGKTVHKAWKGVLKYREDNPEYVEDTRDADQRRKFLDRAKNRPNPRYVEDERTSTQRRQYVWKQIAVTFDPDTVKTKSDASEALQKWREEEEKKAAASASIGEPLTDYIERFISERQAAAIIEDSTARDYRHTASRIAKGFPDTTITELTTDMVQAWETAETNRGVSPTTTIKAHRLLSQVCDYAVRHNVIARNPIEYVEPPRRTASKPNALDEAGVRRVTAILATMGPTPLSTAAFLALHAGLRQGECCGLRWRDVDLDSAELHIRQAIGVADGGAYEKPPKTAKSSRDVPIDSDLIAKLVSRRDAMRSELDRAHMNMTPADFGGLYVCGTISGEYLHPTSLSRKWSSMAGDYDLVGTQGKKIVFTDLRHSYATIAVRSGADVANISANMGHSSTKMTLDVYSSPTREGQRAVAERIGQAMRPSAGEHRDE